MNRVLRKSTSLVTDKRRGGNEATLDTYNALEAIRLRDPEQQLRPDDVIEIARDEAHPLHRHFTWDDTEAAHKHRRQEAQILITSMRIIAETKRNAEYLMPAYQPENRHKGHGSYQATDVLMADPLARRRLVKRAVNDLAKLRKRYASLEELKNVFQYIEYLEEDFNNDEDVA